MIEMERRCYRLTGFTPLLGSQPSSPAVRTQFIASRAPSAGLMEDERDDAVDDDRGLTVFLRDVKTDHLMLYDYTIRGYLKSAMLGAQAQLGVAQPASKVDKFVFVEPRRLFIMRDGAPLDEEDDVFERPLRAMTMRGERVALTASEFVEDPWTVEFSLALLPNKGTKSSAPITWDAIEAALDYGKYQGLGQFRSGGYGRFTWEQIDEITAGAGR